MRPMRPFLLALGLAAAGPAGAAPVEVSFAPPDITPEPICQPQPTLATLRDRWQDWPGETLPDQDTSLIRRDLRLLRASDAQGWFDTITRAQQLLEARDPAYDTVDRQLDRIALLIDANRFGQLREEALVTQVADAGGGSRRGQYLAGSLLLDGIGTEVDRERGLSLITAAAYAGHSEALMHLARLTAEGEDVPGWTYAPELAITLAFGSLVGELDPQICDRMNRIAAEYLSGDLVARDAVLADRWFRLSASLGDPRAALEVARLHLEAETFDKDNAVLLEHLEQSAASGLPDAQVELAHVLATGALTKRDTARARDLLTEAADNGSRNALIALSALLGEEPAETAADRAAQRDVLTRLVDSPEEPAWALVRLADMTLDDHGRWAGEAEARAYLDRAIAAEPDHPIANQRLAGMDMRYATTPQDFEEIVARLHRIVSIHGTTAPMEDLETALTCRAPAAPHMARATHWQAMQRLVGNETLEFDPAVLGELDIQDDPQLIARVQQQALSGRPRSVALYAHLLDGARTEDTRALLMQRAREAGRNPVTQLGRIELALARTPQERSEAIDTLRRAAQNGDRTALIRLLRTLNAEGGHEDERRTLATRLAERGAGLGLQTLAQLDGEASRRALWQEHAQVIDARGDFDAIVFALPHVPEADRADYEGRARASMPCNIHAALALSDALRRIGQRDKARHWVSVAEALTDDTGWKLVAAADARLALDDTDRALDLLNRARDVGSDLALLRLVSLHGDGANGITFTDEQVAEFYATLISEGRPDRAASALARLDFADPQVRDLVTDRVDIDAAYRRAARAGDPTAQYALARQLRARAETPEQLGDYVRWLTAAAKQGHAPAMMELSQAYSLGIAVEASAERSRAWLERAAKAGNADAQDSLRLMQLQDTGDD